MIGFLKKDLLLIVKNLSYTYIFVFLVAVVPLLQNPKYLMPVLSLIFSLLFGTQVLGTMNLDEMAHWEKIATSMPVSTRSEVASKYILTLLLMCFSAVLTLLTGLILNQIISMSLQMIIMYVIYGSFISLFYNTITIPAAYKLGAFKCRNVFFIFVAISTLVPIIFNMLKIKIDLTSLLIIMV